MKWKPIKTAPKDGTEILLFDGHNMRVASWKDTLMVDGIITSFEWVYADIIEEEEWPDFLTVDKPTHWRPKPLPPKNDLNEYCNLDNRTVNGNSGRRAET